MKSVRVAALLLLVCTLGAGCYSSRSRSSGASAKRDAGTPPLRDAMAGARPPRDAGSPHDAGDRKDASAEARDAGKDAAVDVAPDTTLDAGSTPPPLSTEPNLRVAFVGDQSLGPRAVSVLELIRAEGAAFVVHEGDFDYVGNPSAWLAQLDGVLGADFPYFASVGNHDLSAWDGVGGYQALLEERLLMTPGASCNGRLGVRSSCTYRGLLFVLSGVGTLDVDHEDFLASALGATDHVFKVCSWHKNQHDMQVGTKADEVGWGAYQVCQQFGALIVTAHEHSYSRTYTLNALGDQVLGHGPTGPPEVVTLVPGSTSVLVVGLGGHSRRAFDVTAHADDTWWASIYALGRQVHGGVQTGSATSIEDGALFIDFHVDDNPRRARGYFKTTGGAVVDTFTLEAPAR